jgi:hypothetical protein
MTMTIQKQRGRQECAWLMQSDGISYNELKDAAGGDLVPFMAGEIKKAVDEEIRRLAKECP